MLWKKKKRMLNTLFLILVQQAKNCSKEEIETVADLYVALSYDIGGKKGANYIASLCHKGTDAIKALESESAENSGPKVTGGNKNEEKTDIL